MEIAARAVDPENGRVPYFAEPVAGIAGQPLPGLWPIEDWPADFQLTEQETLDGVLITMQAYEAG